MSFYGWVPDKPDHRDALYVPPRTTKRLPDAFSLRDKMPPVYDQGQLGACTAHGIGGCVEYQQMLEGEAQVTPSRLFIYYNERAMEGTIDSDSGASVRDGIKSVGTVGAPPETDWPYDIAKFREKPPAEAYTDAKQHIAEYGRIAQNAQSFQRTCYLAKHPFTFGFTVYESFETEQVARSGIVPMPGFDESAVGGHCVMGIGWKLINDELYLECRNSWGSAWGDHGYFWLPMQYVCDSQLASDFWHLNRET